MLDGRAIPPPPPDPPPPPPPPTPPPVMEWCIEEDVPAALATPFANIVPAAAIMLVALLEFALAVVVDAVGAT